MGNIYAMEEILKKPKNEQDKYLPLNQEEYNQVQVMNRASRRKWYRENKKRRISGA